MSDMQPQGVFKAPGDLKTFHESSDLDLKGIVVFTIVMVVLCAATMVGLKMVMNQFVADEADAKEQTLPRLIVDAPIDGPRLQADPGRERIEITQRDRKRLNTYGLVDSKTGTAHIPIDRAMAILAKSGLPHDGKIDQFHPRQGSSKASGDEPEAAPAPKTEPDAGAKP